MAVEDYVNSSMKSQLPTEDFSVEENEMDNGGFGTVHRGKKTSDGSLIAVKFSRDGHSMYPQAEYAALKELAQLNHANIVKVTRHFNQRLFNHEFFNHEFFNHEFFNHELLNHELFNHELFNHYKMMVEKFMVDLMVEEFMVE